MPTYVKQPFRDRTARDGYGGFEYTAHSDEARKLSAHIHAEVLKTESRQRARRRPDAIRFADTIERFIGELLRAKAKQASGGTGRFSRSMSDRGFVGAPVSGQNVLTVRDSLKKLDYLDHTEGSPSFGPGFDQPIEQKLGEAAKFEAKPKLVTLAEQLGIRLEEIDRHFRIKRMPIEARMSSIGDWRGKDRGQKVRFSHTLHTQALEAEVVALNEFLSGFVLTGANHSTFYRLFNQCDDLKTYGWDKGGRLYSDSGSAEPSYQNLPSHVRSQIKINGESVVELDITSSYLTIFHALMRAPLRLSPNEDPYAKVYSDRVLVKGWFTASFGGGKLLERWPQELSERYADEHDGMRPTDICSARVIRQRAIAVYPTLDALEGSGLGWSELMFAESAILIGAMLHLMRQGTPSLPVHDALIVRASDAAHGAIALYDHFYAKLGTVPIIKVKGGSEHTGDAILALHDDYSKRTPREPTINIR